MKFVLFTRFAMRFAEDNPRRRYEIRPDWIDYRMGLFRKYCLPSVLSQTFKNFDWYFLVHPDFPGFDFVHTSELTAHGNILWIKADWKEDQIEVGELLSNHYKNEWVCSMKVDSDDMIRKDYLERIAKIATEEESWISFWRGYMMKNGYAAERNYSVNPFVAHVEYANPFKSVFRVGHTAIKADAERRNIPLKMVNDPPGWVQVDHGDNIKNLVKRKLVDFKGSKFSADKLKKDFIWNE